MCKNLKTTFGVLASVCSVCPHIWCVGFSLLFLSPIWCVGFSLLFLSPTLVCWLSPALSVPNVGMLASACSVCPQLTAGCRRAGNPQAPEERVWGGYEGVCAGGPGVLWGSDGGAQLPDQPGAPEHRLPHAEQPPGHGGGGAGRGSIPGGSAHRSVSPCHTHTCHRTFLEQSSSGTSKIPMYSVPREIRAYH